MPSIISGLNGIDNVAPNTIQAGDIQNDAVLLANLTPSVRGQIGFTGDKNRVINGSCQIVNVATFVATTGTGGYGGPEMFRVTNANAGGQFTQSQGSLTFGGNTLPTVRQTVDTANTNITGGSFWTGVSQAFEGFNVFDLRGKPVALSFVFNTNVTGTYSVRIATAQGTPQSYVTTINATANVPVQVSIPIPAIPLATTIANSNAAALFINVGALNTGTLQTGTLNSWQSGDFLSATGATNWGATAGNFIELTNLQLEEGTVATEFVRRSYGQELLLTQRYYFSGVATGAQQTTTVAITYRHLGVLMRATPTVSVAGGASLNIEGLGNPANQSTSFGGTNTDYLRASTTFTATGAVGTPCTLTLVASARL